MVRWLRHSEERSDEAIQGVARSALDCFAQLFLSACKAGEGLAMTNKGMGI